MASAKLLPGPDGSSKRPKDGPVKHRRSDMPPPFSVDIDDSDEPDLERIVATRHADAIIAFIFGQLALSFGPGRIQTALIHNGWTYPVTDHDVRQVHRNVNGKMTSGIELVDLSPPPAPPNEPEEDGDQIA